MRSNFGYMGRLSSLNGLTNWMYKNTSFSYEKMKQVIVMYGEQNIPNYKKYGHLDVAADYIAKKIQQNNKFSHFTIWVNNLK